MIILAADPERMTVEDTTATIRMAVAAILRECDLLEAAARSGDLISDPEPNLRRIAAALPLASNAVATAIERLDRRDRE